MYTIALIIHSWVRWIALFAGVAATIAATRADEDAKAERTSLFLMIALDIQMLLGLVLYFALSPFTTEALKDFSAAMRSAPLRFWAVEHVTMMLAALVLVHVGRVLARKAPTADAKRARLLVCCGLATIVMVLGMPWPGLASGRPLFRF
jgi:hypothetical protein